MTNYYINKKDNLSDLDAMKSFNDDIKEVLTKKMPNGWILIGEDPKTNRIICENGAAPGDLSKVMSAICEFIKGKLVEIFELKKT